MLSVQLREFFQPHAGAAKRAGGPRLHQIHPSCSVLAVPTGLFHKFFAMDMAMFAMDIAMSAV